ncbi:acyltransferase family protein [Saccharothrix syringae]|uniref:acyltransferase family protein n=1 Tax=Saccharothrix syringae TaxID=103733 RepID=UPI00068ABFF1|nr:acyltransferase family protein [Saccharothrix syringae]
MALATGESTPAAAATPARPGGSTARGDIQGLRALAVALVVCYHLRPDWLTGGFVGVDVFFVISGFLIIGTLTGEARRTGRVRLLAFYARRVRRLLPAATVVLVATTAAALALFPLSRQSDVLREVVFSALNAQNWLLAVLSNDYGHAGVGASPVQHFWSLAVEEQFYLVIPLVLLGACALAARRGGRPARYAAAAVGLITVASFAFSVYYTPLDHGAAYFITPTRMWELGIGGLAAMAAHRLRPGRVQRAALGWGGLAAVLVSAVVFTTDLVFPGWVAAVPVLGTAGMLVAGLERNALSRLLGVRPLTYVGDISYSLYLWHWPVVVLLLEVSGRTALNRYEVLAAGAASLVLAALSTRFVEAPFRRSPRPRFRATYALGAGLVALSVAVASTGWAVAEAELAGLRGQSALDADHPGALALDPVDPRPVPPGVPLVPAVSVAAEDVPFRGLTGDCGIHDFTAPPEACTYGRPDAPRTVVVVGDSHAGQYSTPLGEFVRLDGGGRWRVKVMIRNGCPFNAVPPAESGWPLEDCARQNAAQLEALRAMKPDLVVTSAMSPESYRDDLKWGWESTARMVEGYRTMLTALSDAHIPVAVIRELPRPARPVVACLERNPRQPGACDTPRAEALPPTSPLVEAATGIEGVSVVDLTDWICRADTCPAVVGNVVVYRDNHLTDTYAKSLAGPLLTALGLR